MCRPIDVIWGFFPYLDAVKVSYTDFLFFFFFPNLNDIITFLEKIKVVDATPQADIILVIPKVLGE